MDAELILKLAENGCMAYDSVDFNTLMEKAGECEAADISPEDMLDRANQCCGLYEFYNPIRLLKKALLVNDLGYDPVLVLEKALAEASGALHPVRILSGVIEREDVTK